MSNRSYADRCGIARALDLVGERWALLVVRELLLGPKRFTDLRAGLPLVGPDMLSQRLRELEAAGIVARTTLEPPARARVYELTPRGMQLEPVILALGRFGSTEEFPQGDAGFGPDAAVLALKTLFDPAAAAGLRASVELRLGEWTYALRIADGALAARQGTVEQPDLTITTEPSVLAAVLWHGRPANAGGLVLRGDAALAEQFGSLFPMTPDHA